MRSVATIPVVLCAACNFTVAAATSAGDGADLSVASDLAPATADAVLPPDLGLDPCAPARTPPLNVLGVRCAIGTPPVVDGDLSEWGTLDYTLTHVNAQAQTANAWQDDPTQDNADCSMQFALRWDLTSLYVAMHVNDDIRGVHPTAPMYQPYLDDAVELYLDGNGDRTATYDADDWQFIVTADAHSEVYKTAVAMGAVPSSYFAVKNDATGAGYSVEFAVPWSTLGANAVINGRIIGVDFLVDDDDLAGGTTQQLSRYLLWWNMATTGCNYPSACTSNFGSAQLVGR